MILFEDTFTSAAGQPVAGRQARGGVWRAGTNPNGFRHDGAGGIWSDSAAVLQASRPLPGAVTAGMAVAFRSPGPSPYLLLGVTDDRAHPALAYAFVDTTARTLTLEGEGVRGVTVPLPAIAANSYRLAVQISENSATLFMDSDGGGFWQVVAALAMPGIARQLRGKYAGLGTQGRQGVKKGGHPTHFFMQEGGDPIWGVGGFQPLRDPPRHEADTLYLPDWDDLLARPDIEHGSLLRANRDDPRPPSEIWGRAPGRFTKGISSRFSPLGTLCDPCINQATLGGQTTEFWVQGRVDWNKWQEGDLLRMGNYIAFIAIGFTPDHATLYARYKHPFHGGTDTTVEWPCAVRPADAAPGRPFLGRGEWHHVAFHVVPDGQGAKGRIFLTLDGLRGGGERREAHVPLGLWADDAWQADGIVPFLGDTGRNNTQAVLSDLRISAVPRVPGLPPALPASAGQNTLTIAPDTPTGSRWYETMRGVLGANVSDTPALRPLRQQLPQIAALSRVAKLLPSTPVKPGGADTAHPSRGKSGQYAYDWQVVDRTLGPLADVGMGVYISLFGVPQLLGGSALPNADLINAANGAENAVRPTLNGDFSAGVRAYGVMVSDLVYHIVAEKKWPVAFWSVWNEPDGSWPGTPAQFFDLAFVTEKNVRAAYHAAGLNPASAFLVGPEVGSPFAHFRDSAGRDTLWMEAWLRAVKARPDVRFDGLSYHNYEKTLSSTVWATALRDRVGREIGLSLPPLLNGEYSWAGPTRSQNAGGETNKRNLDNNTWGASNLAAMLFCETRYDHIAHILTYANSFEASGFAQSGAVDGYNAFTGGPGYHPRSPIGGADTTGHVTAQGNVLRALRGFGSRLVRADWQSLTAPAVQTLAGRTPDGDLTVALAYPLYRVHEGKALRLLPVTLRLPRSWDGASVESHMIIDDQSGSIYDAGLSREAPANVAGRGQRVATDGTLPLVIRPRGVHILRLRPLEKGRASP